MTHAEMVEEVIKLHEWVKHWWQRAEDAEKFAAGLEANLAAVIQRAEAAESKLAEATEDTALLDWLDNLDNSEASHRPYVGGPWRFVSSEHPAVGYWKFEDQPEMGRFESLRAAIRAARRMK